MGQSYQKLRQALGVNEQKRVLLVGPNGAGKTCLLYGLKLGFDETFTTMPTVGFNVETWTHKFKTFTIWDLGLRSKMRPLVKHYTPATDMVIFMLDRSDSLWDADELFLQRIERSASTPDHAGGLRGAEATRSGQEPQDNWLGEKSLRLSQIAVRRHVTGIVFREEAPYPLATLLRKDWRRSYGGDGFSDLISRRKGPYHGWLGQTWQGDTDELLGGSNKEGATGGYRSSDPLEAGAAEAAEAGVEGEPVTLAAAELADDVFLQAFQDRQLKPFGPVEMMRLSLLKRLEGSSALATLETARLQGCVPHATRMHFWATRIFAAPLPERVTDTRSFLEEHPELLPKLDADREVLIRQAYSEKIDREHDAGAYTGELDSFCSLVRLSFLLLKAMPRREAIQRLDAMLRRWEAKGRKFHDTRQYVALQLAHLALTQHPSLQEKPFTRLQELCPELCEEDCRLACFQAPDLQPLPSKLDSPPCTWHEQLNDQEFLEAVRTRSLSSWGLPSLARLSYLYLSELGRPSAVQKLLGDLEDARSVKALNLGLFAHETLAYFTIHMIHYFIASQELSMAEPFSDLVKKCDKIVDPTLYRAYYSDQAIHCTEARNSFVVPDRCPLPDLLPQ
ncbi:unnamed protein product, partial [Cladocopium goreaui]